MRSFIATCLSLAGLTAAASPAWAQQPEIVEGEPFPEIVLPDMETGEPASIRDFRGQKVVLHVFASW